MSHKLFIFHSTLTWPGIHTPLCVILSDLHDKSALSDIKNKYYNDILTSHIYFVHIIPYLTMSDWEIFFLFKNQFETMSNLSQTI